MKKITETLMCKIVNPAKEYMTEPEDDGFNNLDRIKYLIKRHIIFVLVMCVCGYTLFLFKPELKMLFVNNIFKTSWIFFASIIGTKLGFPNLNIQSEIKKGNVAMALLMVGVIIAVSLVI